MVLLGHECHLPLKQPLKASFRCFVLITAKEGGAMC